MKKKNRSHRCHINRTRPSHGHKYTKYKVSQYDDGYLKKRLLIKGCLLFVLLSNKLPKKHYKMSLHIMLMY